MLRLLKKPRRKEPTPDLSYLNQSTHGFRKLLLKYHFVIVTMKYLDTLVHEEPINQNR